MNCPGCAGTDCISCIIRSLQSLQRDLKEGHAARNVARFQLDPLVVDTSRVNDGVKPYETGICHPNYHQGDWVVVEAYDSREAAEKGHQEWVAKMTSFPMPEVLEDCHNSKLAQIAKKMFGDQFLPPTPFDQAKDENGGSKDGELQ